MLAGAAAAHGVRYMIRVVQRHVLVHGTSVHTCTNILYSYRYNNVSLSVVVLLHYEYHEVVLLARSS